MVEINLYLYILLTTFKIFTYNSQSCTKFICKDMDFRHCASINSINEIAIDICSNNYRCPIEKDFGKDNKLWCEEKSQQMSYPGGYCKFDKECISRRCDTSKNKCIGYMEQELCKYHQLCPFGYSCQLDLDNNNRCLHMKDENAECVDDNYCKIGLGCHNNKCIKLFTLPDGEKVSNKTNSFLCQSGHITNNICSNLELISDKTQPCDEFNPCKYSFNNQTIVSNSFCQCGLNSKGDKYCYRGNKNNQFFENYLTAVKNLLYIEPHLLELCNSVERDGMCVERIKWDRRNDFKTLKSNYNNNQALSTQSHLFENSEDCMIKAFIPEYVETPPQRNSSCPKFNCNKDKSASTCQISHNDFSQDSVNATIYPGICNQPDYTCAFSTDDIISQRKTKGFCLKKNFSSEPSPNRLPGEDCINDTDCMFIKKCLKNKCDGTREGQSCLDSLSCVAGLACIEGKCQRQRKISENCSRSVECENHLVCFKEKCILAYSAPVGTDMKLIEEEEKYMNYFCESSYVNINGICSNIFYSKTGYKIFNDNFRLPDKNGYVQCSLGDEIIYTDGDNDIKINCGCGFNSEGVGYFALPIEKSLPDIKNYQDSYREIVLNNKCHTVNRYDCYQNVSQNDSNKLFVLKNKAFFSHLYYKGVDCLQSDINYSTMNFVMMSLLISLPSIVFVIILLSIYFLCKNIKNKQITSLNSTGEKDKSLL